MRREEEQCGEVIEVVSWFSLEDDVEWRAGEALKTFGARKKMSNVRSVYLGVKMKLCVAVAVSTLLHRAESYDLRGYEQNNLGVKGMSQCAEEGRRMGVRKNNSEREVRTFSNGFQ